MSAQQLIAELDHTLSNASGSQCRQMLSCITDLFLSEERQDDDQIRVYDEVIGRLIERIETSALAELSERLAPIDHAPPNVILRLATNDEIHVSRPVLSKSNQLSDADLIAIANLKSQAHLLAICARTRLGETVTDVLVSRGNVEVAHCVVANPGASFSERGFRVWQGGQKRTTTSHCDWSADRNCPCGSFVRCWPALRRL
jgi:uncharacterized protein (DUF2336 family)